MHMKKAEVLHGQRGARHRKWWQLNAYLEGVTIKEVKTVTKWLTHMTEASQSSRNMVR